MEVRLLGGLLLSFEIQAAGLEQTHR